MKIPLISGIEVIKRLKKQDLLPYRGQIISTFNMLEQYAKIASLPAESQKNMGIAIRKPNGEEEIISPEQVKKMHDGLVAGLISWRKALQFGSPSGIDDAFLQAHSVFARFHTHPLNDREYFPSGTDIGQTMIMGPTVLFS